MHFKQVMNAKRTNLHKRDTRCSGTLIGVSKSGQNLSSTRRLFEDYSKTFRRLFEDYSKTIRRLFENYSKTIQRLLKLL